MQVRSHRGLNAALVFNLADRFHPAIEPELE